MTALLVVVAMAVVAGVAVLVARDRPLLEDDPVGAPALDWEPGSPVGAQDLAEVRFSVALRGYRMEQVDRVLADTQTALAERDARIAQMSRVVAALGRAGAPGAAGAGEAGGSGEHGGAGDPGGAGVNDGLGVDEGPGERDGLGGYDGLDAHDGSGAHGAPAGQEDDA